MKRPRPSINLICDKCGSSMVYWNPEIDDFICSNCNQHVLCEELAEKLKYELDLVDFRLMKIPDWVFTKTYLTEIDLSAEPSDSFHFPFINRLSVIPDKIGRLINLEDFSIAGNAIGKIPSGFCKLKKLKSVTFGGNYIKVIPPEICQLRNLEFLNLYDNSIEFLPPEIGGLKNLKILSIGKNRLKGIPPEIGNLKNLEELSLINNNLETLPDEIGLLTNLETLKLEYNRLKSLPKSIINLPKLKHLTIYGNDTLKYPPPDVAEEGIDAIRNWFNNFGDYHDINLQ